MIGVQSHVLICRGPDCMSRGSHEVYTEFATEVERQGLGASVVQTQCGCVGPLCGKGPVVCAYPTGTWYSPVCAADVAEIVARDLGRAQRVDRLVAATIPTLPEEH